MADISTLMGVNVDNISQFCGVASDTINTVMGLTWRHGPQTIGEFWGGGYYFGTLNGNYLICSGVSGEAPTVLQWSSANGTTGATSDTDGDANTATIILAGGTPAASFAAGLSLNGYSDWYLPAKSEIAMIYSNLAVLTAAGAGPFQTTYWSSTEYDAGYAYLSRFNDGTQGLSVKQNVLYVRSIRREAV